MTPEIDAAFDRIKQQYGATSIDRVEEMLRMKKSQRHPLQRGAKYILPGISQKPWHDPYEYPEIVPIVRAFESNHDVLKKEMAAAWQDRQSEFSDYEHYLTRQQNWQALYLYRNRRLVQASASVMPTAFRLLNDHAVETGVICPLLESHFSTLLPGAAIAPHCDLWNFSINLHVAIDIPERCGISVANEPRAWREGFCLLFDYSFQHEAWNRGSRPRTCLLVDLWHPETSLAERAALDVLITEVRNFME